MSWKSILSAIRKFFAKKKKATHQQELWTFPTDGKTLRLYWDDEKQEMAVEELFLDLSKQ